MTPNAERYNPSTDYAPTAIAAAKRLHAKGLIDQPDGGYLTSLGRDAAEQAQTLLTILTTATTKEAA